MEMTFPHIALLLMNTDDLERDEQKYRYRRMSPQVREVADAVKRKYGRF